jgi:type IV secretion system protein TrbL
MGGSSDQVVSQYADSAAHQSATAAGQAVAWLLKVLGPGTEPTFTVIGPAYNRMLSIALLLAGAMISMAVAERILGGPKGAGWDVVPRTVAATMAAFAGLGVVQYGAHYASLMATAWGASSGGLSAAVATGTAHLYAAPTSQQAFGSSMGLLLVALITLLLTLFLYVEMVLRAALILVTTTFIPLVCVMAIWPRLAGAASRLAEFLVLLLLSKFVMVTAIYVGFSMVAYGAIPGDHGMAVGIATLLLATFSPVLLLQGIRIGETTTSNAVRSWSVAGISAATTIGWLGTASRGLRRSAATLRIGSKARAAWPR